MMAVLFALASELADARVNLGRMQAIAFQMQVRLANKQSLDIGATPHARAVALQLRDEELVDPWGTPYRIEIKGNDFLVIGAGSDRTFHPEEWSVRGAHVHAGGRPGVRPRAAAAVERVVRESRDE
jgi:hypothetical protein